MASDAQNLVGGNSWGACRVPANTRNLLVWLSTGKVLALVSERSPSGGSGGGGVNFGLLIFIFHHVPDDADWLRDPVPRLIRGCSRFISGEQGNLQPFHSLTWQGPLLKAT